MNNKFKMINIPKGLTEQKTEQFEYEYSFKTEIIQSSTYTLSYIVKLITNQKKISF